MKAALTVATLLYALAADCASGGEKNSEPSVHPTEEPDLDGVATACINGLAEEDGLWHMQNDCGYDVQISWCHANDLVDCIFPTTRIAHTNDSLSVRTQSSTDARIAVAACRLELPNYHGIAKWDQRDDMFLCAPGTNHDMRLLMGDAEE